MAMSLLCSWTANDTQTAAVRRTDDDQPRGTVEGERAQTTADEARPEGREDGEARS